MWESVILVSNEDEFNKLDVNKKMNVKGSCTVHALLYVSFGAS